MKLYSLKKNHLFSKAYKKGKKMVMKSVCVYCMKNYRDDASYLGITVSTKLGGAVQRNRAKRIIRAAYREIAATCSFSDSYIIVIVARSGCFDGSFGSRDVYGDLLAAFCSLKLFGNEKSSK